MNNNKALVVQLAIAFTIAVSLVAADRAIDKSVEDRNISFKVIGS